MIYLLIVFVLLLVYMHMETRMLEVTNEKIGSPQEKKFKVAFMSDIHIGKMFVGWDRLKKHIEDHDPDCIAFTGDYIERLRHIDKFVKFLKVINPKQIPVLMVWGNHDYKAIRDYGGSLEEFKEKLTKLGCKVLDNQSVTFKKEGKEYCLVGLPDFYYGKPDIEKAFATTKDADRVLVLSHNPEIMYQMMDKEFDVLMCGHFHGAQIYTPFAMEFRAMRRETIWRKGAVRGLKEVDGKTLYLSRGLGNVLLPFRFFSKPEITIFEVE